MGKKGPPTHRFLPTFFVLVSATSLRERKGRKKKKEKEMKMGKGDKRGPCLASKIS